MSATSGKFVKNLLSFGVLFGLKSKKLTGVSDATHTFTGNIDIVAPDQIVLPLQVPNFFEEGRYFRITGGGGANEDVLFRVSSVSGSTIRVDTSTNSLSNFTGLATLDARFAVVHNDQTISRLSAKGNTIYNVNNYTTTGLDDGSQIAEACADHYHAPDPLNEPLCFDFVLADWFLTDAGDTYSIDVAHDLNTICPSVHLFEDDSEVWVHNIRVIDANTLRIKVAADGMDCRFEGRGVISRH